MCRFILIFILFSLITVRLTHADIYEASACADKANAAWANGDTLRAIALFGKVTRLAESAYGSDNYLTALYKRNAGRLLYCILPALPDLQNLKSHLDYILTFYDQSIPIINKFYIEYPAIALADTALIRDQLRYADLLRRVDRIQDAIKIEQNIKELENSQK